MLVASWPGLSHGLGFLLSQHTYNVTTWKIPCSKILCRDRALFSRGHPGRACPGRVVCASGLRAMSRHKNSCRDTSSAQALSRPGISYRGPQPKIGSRPFYFPSLHFQFSSMHFLLYHCLYTNCKANITQETPLIMH